MRFANGSDEINSFPLVAWRAHVCAATIRSKLVSSIQIPAKLERLSFAMRRVFAAALLQATAGARSRLLRALRGEDLPNWTSLNSHLLADIGESTATAAQEALRDPFSVPLGSIGFAPKHARSN